jgi:hypothetical protein
VVLVVGVLVGWVAGAIRAYLSKRRYRPAILHHIWLVIVSLLPQVLAFYLPAMRAIIPGWLASVGLVSSLIGLLIFVWLNRAYHELWVAGLGLSANLLVIIANGGLMPITVATAAALYPGAGPGSIFVGSRLGWSKNIVLTNEAMHFGFLSDCLLMPGWIPWRYAFSLGDVLIAAGVFWLLWNGGARQEPASTLERNGT